MTPSGIEPATCRLKIECRNLKMEQLNTSLWNRLWTCRNKGDRMNETEYCVSHWRPRAAEGRIECHKMHTADIQTMPQNSFELRDSLLNVIYITILSFRALCHGIQLLMFVSADTRKHPKNHRYSYFAP